MLSKYRIRIKWKELKNYQEELLKKIIYVIIKSKQLQIELIVYI